MSSDRFSLSLVDAAVDAWRTALLACRLPRVKPASRTLLAAIVRERLGHLVESVRSGVMGERNYPAAVNGLRLVVEGSGSARLFDSAGLPYVCCPACHNVHGVRRLAGRFYRCERLGRTFTAFGGLDLEARVKAASSRAVLGFLGDSAHLFTLIAPGYYACSETARRGLDWILSEECCPFPHTDEERREATRAELLERRYCQTSEQADELARRIHGVTPSSGRRK